MTFDLATYQKAADTIRALSADIVQKAGSGHPGMPMGCADFAVVLWARHLRQSPSAPHWLGRDRYVQSAGHGSPLVYSLLNLFGYSLPMDELKQFRQWGSRTPGHPEFGDTPGVEVTTGPLGTGLATGVGMAIAAKQLAARMDNDELFNQRIFVLSSDGCMMEGITHEAASLAGHQQLDNLIAFYDDNSITIEGGTDLAFSEDVAARYKAYGWHVIEVDGHDMTAIDQALSEAVASVGKPTMIVGKTTIGRGAPSLAGSPKTHGAALGEEEVAALKAALGLDPQQSFFVPGDVKTFFAECTQAWESEAADWNTKLAAFRSERPEKAKLLDALASQAVPADLAARLVAATPEKPLATRKSAGAIIQKAAELVPALSGGAADLNPSTNTHMDAEADFSPTDRAGRNVHFGVREFGMGLAANGMALYGTAIPFTATFMVFSDFMKPALRLAAIQKVHVVNVFTHDSVFVGEDGPTHQPVEHLMMMRGIPGYTVLRPGDSREVAQAWAVALAGNGPFAMALTRQTVDNVPEELADRIDVAKGAYVVSDDENADLLLIATGSELGPTLGAAGVLREKGHAVRVVSMPSWELFDAQSAEYREQVLPAAMAKRVTVEAGITQGWERYAGSNGLTIGIDHFGDSAPYKVLAEEYGLTAETLATRIAAHFA